MNALGRSDSGAPLMATRQRLGLVPTWRFWNDRSNKPAMTVALVVFFTAQLAAILVLTPVVPEIVAGLIATIVAPFVALGFVERRLRRAVENRRRAALFAQGRRGRRR